MQIMYTHQHNDVPPEDIGCYDPECGGSMKLLRKEEVSE
jgi:hypothetical protein